MTIYRSDLPDVRLRHLAQHLHDLGPRPLFYFLREVMAGADIELHLERYGRIPAATVRLLGGDQLPEPVRRLHVFGGGGK